MSTMRRYAGVAVIGICLVGCANQSPTTQRVLSGTGIGAGGGLLIGAIAGKPMTGLAIGAAAGAAGGLLVDASKGVSN